MLVIDFISEWFILLTLPVVNKQTKSSVFIIVINSY